MKCVGLSVIYPGTYARLKRVGGASIEVGCMTARWMSCGSWEPRLKLDMLWPLRSSGYSSINAIDPGAKASECIAICLD